jgi:hypothetical protein
MQPSANQTHTPKIDRSEILEKVRQGAERAKRLCRQSKILLEKSLRLIKQSQEIYYRVARGEGQTQISPPPGQIAANPQTER